MPNRSPTTRNSAGYSETDLYLVLEEALSDPSRTPAQRVRLLNSLLTECVASTSAFQKLCRLKAPELVEAGLLRTLFGRAWESCQSEGERRRFRFWLEQSERNWPKLLGEQYYRSLLHPRDQLPLLTRSQKRAWQVLEEMCDLVFSGVLIRQALRPRTSVLIAGPSGIGKTHLLEAFTDHLGIGHLRLTFGSWTVTNAKHEPSTWEVVRDFLCQHERSILQVDEADKLSPDNRSEWSQALFNEMYALLDRSWFSPAAGGDPRNPKQSLADKRLRESCVLVGTGTWQNLWQVRGGALGKIGFRSGDEPAMEDQVRAARVIPTELLNRFSEELVLLEPLTQQDFAALIEESGLAALASAVGVPIDLDQAVETGLGMRWLEGLTRRILVKRRAISRAEVLQSSQPKQVPQLPAR